MVLEAHATGVETIDSMGMGNKILQEISDGLGGGFGSLCLGGCECAKGNKESGVDGTIEVNECADDFLEIGEIRWRLRVALVESVHHRSVPYRRSRCVLETFGKLVLKFGESLRNVAGHGHAVGTRFEYQSSVRPR